MTVSPAGIGCFVIDEGGLGEVSFPWKPPFIESKSFELTESVITVCAAGKARTIGCCVIDGLGAGEVSFPWNSSNREPIGRVRICWIPWTAMECLDIVMEHH